MGSSVLGIYVIFSIKILNCLNTEAFSTVISNIFIQSGFTPSILIKGIGLNSCTAISYYKSIGIKNLDTINACLINTSNINQSTRYFVYILRCCDNSYYTGHTSNITQRLNQHQNGIGCVYTKTRTPVELVYLEEVSEKSLAIKREKQIKKLNLFDKELLFEKGRIN